MRHYKLVTITIHEDILRVLKEFCSQNKWTLSRFLSTAGEEKLAREKKEGFE